MKVIVAGFPKTGTKSMNAALSRLGYTVYDAAENTLLLYKEYGKIFRDGWTTQDFRQMYETVDAVTDIPASYFWEEIFKAFPDAKIVLTLRENEDIWYKSFKKQFETQDASYTLRLLGCLSPTMRQAMKSVGEPTLTTVLGLTSRSRFFWVTSHYNEALTKLKYRAHNAYVLQNAPPDKLLVFKCNEGWEPLCKFLGRPVPDEPFPHKNIGGSIVKEGLKDHPLIFKLRKEMMISSATLFVFAVVGSYVLYTKGPSAIWRSSVGFLRCLFEKLAIWR